MSVRFSSKPFPLTRSSSSCRYLQGMRQVSVRATSREEMAQALQTREVGNSRSRYVLVTGLDPRATYHELMSLFSDYDLMPRAVDVLKVGLGCTTFDTPILSVSEKQK